MLAEKWQRNIAALWIAQTLTMVAFAFVFPFIPLYVQTLGVQGTTDAARWAGVIGAASAISMAIAQPIWGGLSDQWGRKPMVLRSMIGSAVITVLMGFTTSPEQLLVLRFLQGAVTGTLAASNALVATTTPKRRLGFALGIMQMALFLGTSVGPLLGGVIADSFGFRMAFYAGGILMAFGAAIVLKFVHEDFTKPAEGTVRPSMWAASRSLLHIALVPILISVIFMIQFGNIIVTPVLSLFVSQLHGGENVATAAGFVLAGAGAMSAMSALAIGRVSDRIGHGRILSVCLAGAALTYLPQYMVQDVWQLVVLRMMLGAFLGGLMPTANAMLAGSISHERRGAAFGLAGTATALANAAGPLSAAAIASFWGLRAVFLATAILFGLAYIWVSVALRRRVAAPPGPGDQPVQTQPGTAEEPRAAQSMEPVAPQRGTRP